MTPAMIRRLVPPPMAMAQHCARFLRRSRGSQCGAKTLNPAPAMAATGAALGHGIGNVSGSSNSSVGFGFRLQRRGLGSQAQTLQPGGQRRGSLYLVPSTWDDWSSRTDLLRPRAAAVTQEQAMEEPVAAASIIDGKAIAQQIKAEVAAEVAKMKEAVGKVPGLAVLLVGSRKDSQSYVRSKKKSCEEVGIVNYGAELPEDATKDEILDHVLRFNADPNVHGILVQLPLPKHVPEEAIVGAVSMDKDVDGFHPMNVGRLAMQGRQPLFMPCTPRGCIELLLRSGVEIAGKHAVVIGRSNIVGMPAALLLQRHNATVTVVHSYTPDPAEVTRRADIVIAAAGVAELVRKDWIKPGAVVIDVGINPVEDPGTKRGYRMVGDVCYKEVSTIASAITPVPGGVGPMTIAMLLQNTVESAKRAYDGS